MPPSSAKLNEHPTLRNVPFAACIARVKSCNGFAHSNGDVRDAARELTVELHALVGEQVRKCVPLVTASSSHVLSFKHALLIFFVLNST